jgi:hypothetical protein
MRMKFENKVVRRAEKKAKKGFESIRYKLGIDGGTALLLPNKV